MLTEFFFLASEFVSRVHRFSQVTEGVNFNPVYIDPFAYDDDLRDVPKTTATIKSSILLLLAFFWTEIVWIAPDNMTTWCLVSKVIEKKIVLGMFMV